MAIPPIKMLFRFLASRMYLQDAIEHSLVNLDSIRETNLLGRILWLQQNRATEYFSRWIELKESLL